MFLNLSKMSSKLIHTRILRDMAIVNQIQGDYKTERRPRLGSVCCHVLLPVWASKEAAQHFNYSSGLIRCSMSISNSLKGVELHRK